MTGLCDSEGIFSGATYRWSVCILCVLAWAWHVHNREKVPERAELLVDEAILTTFPFLLVFDGIVQCCVIRVCKTKMSKCPYLLNVKLYHDIFYGFIVLSVTVMHYLLAANEAANLRSVRLVNLLLLSKIGLEVAVAVLLKPSQLLTNISLQLSKAVGKTESKEVLDDIEDASYQNMENEKVMMGKFSGAIPPGMVSIVLKDRIAGDSADGMVRVLYEILPNGMQRRDGMQIPDESEGWVVYVPAEDAAELQEVWLKDMQLARRNIENQFKGEGKKRRAPRLIFQMAEQDQSSGSSTTQSISANSTSAGSSDFEHESGRKIDIDVQSHIASI